jgi:hypothetical protein
MRSRACKARHVGHHQGGGSRTVRTVLFAFAAGAITR